MELYHGSDKIIEKPKYGFGRSDNDYGMGFYCTKIWDMAAEWAAGSERGGFVNIYRLDIDGLTTLKLLSDDFHILHWLAILLSNRKVRLSSPIEKRGETYLTENYLINTTGYDIISGYRADDSYFSFVRAFLSNTISVEQLSKAMRLGDLGVQYMLRNPAAFNRLDFVGADVANGADFYPKRIKRDSEARQNYYDLLEKEDTDSHYIRDIMKGSLSDEELRLL